MKWWFLIWVALLLLALYRGLIHGKAPLIRYFQAPFWVIVWLLIGVVLMWILQLLPHWLTLIGYPVVALLTMAFCYSCGRQLAEPESPLHFRGTRLLSPTSRRSAPASTGIAFAGETVTPLDETKHFKLLGTTGTGKTTAIRELLKGALARTDRAVIADPSGGYRDNFYDPSRGDVILNPFAPESPRWDLFAEIKEPYDYPEIARSLIPDGHGDERIWRQYAQTYLTAILKHAHRVGLT